MSKTEERFEQFLIENNIEYICSYKIKNIPFTSNHTHLVDFYLPEKDLYIEIKGLMTLLQINILRYLHSIKNKHFYILQMTEEDWINPYEKSKHGSTSNKIKINIQKQFDEVKTLDSEQLENISLNRLESFVEYRKYDLDRWKEYTPKFDLFILLGLDIFDDKYRVNNDHKFNIPLYKYSLSSTILDDLFTLCHELTFDIDDKTIEFISSFSEYCVYRVERYISMFDRDSCIKFEHIPFMITYNQLTAILLLYIYINELNRFLTGCNLFNYFDDVIDLHKDELEKRKIIIKNIRNNIQQMLV